MLRTIGSLGDRLLTRLVPKTTAAAQCESCYNDQCGGSSPCLRRICCINVCTGNKICGNCTYTC